MLIKFIGFKLDYIFSCSRRLDVLKILIKLEEVFISYPKSGKRVKHEFELVNLRVRKWNTPTLEGLAYLDGQLQSKSGFIPCYNNLQD